MKLPKITMMQRNFCCLKWPSIASGERGFKIINHQGTENWLRKSKK